MRTLTIKQQYLLIVDQIKQIAEVLIIVHNIN